MMTRWRIPAASATLLLAAVSSAVAEDEVRGRFQAVAGGIAASEGVPATTTILVDTHTGQTWILAGGEAAEWVPVPFTAQRPPRLLPRLENEPIRLGR
jgi:hypothetical protein